LLATLADALCLLVCGWAAVVDARAYRIPNWLTAGGLALGLVVNGVAGGLVAALAGAGVMLFAGGLLGGLRFIGMGDAKLLVAAGALLRWPQALPLLVHVALAGGLVAIVLLVRRRLRPDLRALRDRSPARRMPYGVAIFLGAVWTVLARHVDALRVLALD
jgi:prepilin peptidase CpaA